MPRHAPMGPKAEQILLRAYLETIEEITATSESFRRLALEALGRSGELELRVLTLLCGDEMVAPCLSALSARMAMPMSNLSRIVAGLVASGAIEMQDADTDRRQRTVRATEAGRAQRDAMIATLRPALRPILHVSKVRDYTQAAIAAGRLRRMHAQCRAVALRHQKRRRRRT